MLSVGGGREPQFEPFTQNGQFEPENEKIVTEMGKPKSGTEKIKTETREAKTANGQMRHYKIKSKENTSPVQKYSNHIEFVDYLPTHEVITYRHLFAYGFYIV